MKHVIPPSAALTLADLNTAVNHEPRIAHQRLAEALGYTDKSMMPRLVERHREALERFGAISVTVTENTDPKGRGRPGKTCWLNKRQALFICTKSETANATEATIQMVEVFDDWLKGEAKPVKVRAHRRALPAPATSEVAVRLAAMEQQMRMLTASPFSRFTGRDAEVWVEPVRGDRMSPTLRHMQDFVIVRRAHGYEGEGVYLFRHDVGGLCIGRVGSALNGKRELMLYGDNKHYGESAVPQDWFNEHVIGIVIADVKVRQTRELSPRAHCA